MWKKINFKTQKYSQNNGFITLEILVGIIIALAFVAVSLQTLVYAKYIQVTAIEDKRADELIQEDIENVNNLALAISDPDGDCKATTYNNGYAKALWDDLEPNAPSSANPPPTKSLSKLVKTDPFTGSVTITEEGKTFGLKRTHVSLNRATAPYKTLKIYYEVKEWDGNDFDINNDGRDVDDDVIADRYVEVIPDVALECP